MRSLNAPLTYAILKLFFARSTLLFFARLGALRGVAVAAPDEFFSISNSQLRYSETYSRWAAIGYDQFVVLLIVLSLFNFIFFQKIMADFDGKELKVLPNLLTY